MSKERRKRQMRPREMMWNPVKLQQLLKAEHRSFQGLLGLLADRLGDEVKIPSYKTAHQRWMHGLQGPDDERIIREIARILGCKVEDLFIDLNR